MAAELVNRFFSEVISEKKIVVLDEILHPSFHSISKLSWQKRAFRSSNSAATNLSKLHT